MRTSAYSESLMFIIVAGIIFLSTGNSLLVIDDPNYEALRIDDESNPNQFNGEQADGGFGTDARQEPSPQVDSQDKVLSSKADNNYKNDAYKEQRLYQNKPSTSCHQQCLDNATFENNPDSGAGDEHKSSQEIVVDYDAAKCIDGGASHDSSTRQEHFSLDKRGNKNHADDSKTTNMITEGEEDISTDEQGTDSSSPLSTRPGNQSISFLDVLALVALIAFIVVVNYFLVIWMLRVMEAIDDYWFSWEDL